MKRGLIFWCLFLFLSIFLLAGVEAVQYANCAAVPSAVLGGRTCSAFSSCTSLSGTNMYYLLTSNISSSGDCLSIRANHNVLDLNEYSIKFSQSANGNGITVLRDSDGSRGLEIKNGYVLAGYYTSFDIYVYGVARDVVIHNLYLYAAGIDSSSIKVENEGSNFPTNISIYNNTILMNTTKPGCNMETRECSPCNHYGHLPAGIEMTHVNGPITIDGNSITGYGVIGITHTDCGTLSSQAPYIVRNNYISMWSVVADGYAIAMAGLNNGCSGGTLIINNTIDQLNGRGISVAGWNTETDYGPGNVEISFNNLTVRNGADCETNGLAYGIRIRFGAHDIYVHNNRIKTIAGIGVVDGYKSKDGTGEGLAIGSTSPYGGNNRFESNIIEAYSNDPSEDAPSTYTRYGAAAIYVQDCADSSACMWSYYFNNTIITNNIGIKNFGGNGGGYKAIFNKTTIIRSSGIPVYKPIMIGGWFYGAQDTLLLDTNVTGENVHNIFFWQSGSQQTFRELNLSWSTSIKTVDNIGTPLVSSIEIRDRFGNLVSQGNSNIQGIFAKVLTEVQWIGTSLPMPPPNVTYSPYAISASYPGQPTQTKIVYVNKTLTGANEIVFVFDMGGNSPDVNSDSVVNVIDLAIVVFNQGRSAADSRYAHLDLNEDGAINWQDVQIVVNAV